MNNSKRPTDRPEKLDELFGIDYRTLALFRVAVACVLLGAIVTRAFDLSSLYTDDGAFPIRTVQSHYGGMWCFSFHLLGGSLVYQAALFGIAGLFAVSLAVGYRTRLATVGSWALLVSVNHRVPLITTGGDVLLGMVLFWGMFLPLGARWSLDARRAGASPPTGRVTSIATLAILLQVLWMYFSTGLWKLNELWLDGRALGLALSDDMLARPLGRYLLEFSHLLTALTYAVLVLELIGPFLLFSPWRTNLVRASALAALATMHVGIELTMSILIFSFASLAALTLFVVGSWWERGMLRRLADWLDARFVRAGGWRQKKSKQETAEAGTSKLFEWAQIFLLIYIPLFNISCWLSGPQASGSQPSGALQKFNHLGELIGAGQVWKMFDRPPGEQRFVGLATLNSAGPPHDILRNEATKSPPPRPAQPEPVASQRWMLAMRHLAPERCAHFRPDVARYLIRRWNQRAGELQQVRELELFFFPAPYEAPREAVDGIRLVKLVRSASGEYVVE
jgi:hypothetical protein